VADREILEGRASVARRAEVEGFLKEAVSPSHQLGGLGSTVSSEQDPKTNTNGVFCNFRMSAVRVAFLNT